MKKHRVLAASVLVVLVISMILLVSRPNTTVLSSAATSSQRELAKTQKLLARQIPEHLPYEFLFRRIKFYQDKRMPPERLSQLLQKELDLNAKEAESLIHIGLACLDEVSQQDKRAKKVIAEIRARYPEVRYATVRNPRLCRLNWPPCNKSATTWSYAPALRCKSSSTGRNFIALTEK